MIRDECTYELIKCHCTGAYNIRQLLTEIAKQLGVAYERVCGRHFYGMRMVACESIYVIVIEYHNK